MVYVCRERLEVLTSKELAGPKLSCLKSLLGTNQKMFLMWMRLGCFINKQ